MDRSLLDKPAEERFFENYVTGSAHEFGSVKVDENEIIVFARRYDLQPGLLSSTVLLPAVGTQREWR